MEIRDPIPGEGGGEGAGGRGGLSVGLGRTGGAPSHWEASQVGAGRLELKSGGPFSRRWELAGREGCFLARLPGILGLLGSASLPACFCGAFSGECWGVSLAADWRVPSPLHSVRSCSAWRGICVSAPASPGSTFTVWKELPHIARARPGLRPCSFAVWAGTVCPRLLPQNRPVQT